MSQSALARAAGIAPIRLSWYERGRAVPRPWTLRRLLTVLDLTAPELESFPALEIVERAGRKPESPYGTPRPHGRPRNTMAPTVSAAGA